MRLLSIGPSQDEFRSRMTVHGIVKLVSNGREKTLSRAGVRIVVRSRGEEVGHLLIELPFARADLSNLFEQRFEILLVEEFPVL